MYFIVQIQQVHNVFVKPVQTNKHCLTLTGYKLGVNLSGVHSTEPTFFKCPSALEC